MNTDQERSDVQEKPDIKESKVSLRPHEILDIPLLGGVLMMLYGLTYFIAGMPVSDYKILSNLVPMLFSLLLLAIHRVWFRPDLKSCVSFSFLHDRKLMKSIGIFFLVFAVLWVFAISRLGFAAPTLAGFVEALAAGVCEETAFRVLPISVMMRAYKDSGRYLPALLMPAVLFGLAHFINLYGGGDMTATVLQVVEASIGGIFFAAVYLRSGSIVPSLIIHFLFDFFAFMQGSLVETADLVTASEILQDGILNVVELVLAIVLIAGHRKEIMNVWQNVWGGAVSRSK